MRLYVSIKINLDIPFPNIIQACNMFQPIIPVALLYIKIVWWSHKIKIKTKTKAYKRRSKFNDKVFQMKNRS